MDKELVSIVIWKRGYRNLSEILHLINKNFSIKKYEFWELEGPDIIEFLGRFYPHRNFNLKSNKLREIEDNAFLYLAVVDESPVYKNNVNLNCFNIKKQLRERDEINYLHISDNASEAIKNYQAITKKNEESFAKLLNGENAVLIKDKSQNGYFSLKEFKKRKFETLNDVFETLNENENWAALRNWECFPDNFHLDGHNDIDILVEDFYRTLTILDAKMIFEENFRVHATIKIAGKNVPFDIRSVGDKYYCDKWSKHLLKNNFLDKNNFFRLSHRDYFYTLLYHALFHKSTIKKEYVAKLNRLGKSVFGYSENVLKNRRRMKRFMKKFLRLYKYKVTPPNDLSVNFNPNKLGRYLRIIAREFNLPEKKTKCKKFIKNIKKLIIRRLYEYSKISRNGQ